MKPVHITLALFVVAVLLEIRFFLRAESYALAAELLDNRDDVFAGYCRAYYRGMYKTINQKRADDPRCLELPEPVYRCLLPIIRLNARRIVRPF